MSSTKEEFLYLSNLIERCGFEKAVTPPNLDPHWETYVLKEDFGSGHNHFLVSDEGWLCTINDFKFFDDQVFDITSPGYVSIAWNEIIAGEEFSPYRKLRSGVVWGFYGKSDGWRGFIHGRIPVRSVSIGLSPDFIQQYLNEQWPGHFNTPEEAFSAIRYVNDIPEAMTIMKMMRPSKADKAQPVSYYRDLVYQILNVVVGKAKEMDLTPKRNVTAVDEAHIRSVAQFVDDHYSGTLRIGDLSRAAQMSPTKFKECFKAVMGTTFTQYVLSRRISQAELMLQEPTLSIEFVAHMVGYSCVSRFTQLFNRETGMLPSEYRACFKYKSPSIEKDYGN